MIARLMGRRVSTTEQLESKGQTKQQFSMSHRRSSFLQQGNEEALVGQVRQQFRMNMHETDEAKVRRMLLCSRRGGNQQHDTATTGLRGSV